MFKQDGWCEGLFTLELPHTCEERTCFNLRMALMIPGDREFSVPSLFHETTVRDMDHRDIVVWCVTIF